MRFGKILGLGMLALAGEAAAQGFDPARMAREGVAEPFVGVTTDGTPEGDLFRVETTGVSTAPVIEAAQVFLASLNEAQRARTLFPVDDAEWRHWANIHRFPRQGTSLDEMTPEQKDKAYALLRAALSERGYKTSRDIMRLNHHLGELVANFRDYGEHLYWFTVMGEPSPTEPWGWQIDGHHLVINYLVLGDQVVMTPTFMGSEPVRAASGKYAGTSILELEQEKGLAFMRSLAPEQRRAALLRAGKARGENRAEMFKDNVVIPYEGVRGEHLAAPQREALMDLIGLFVGNIRDGHARIKLEEVREHLDATHFAWIGGTGGDDVFYYRIHSPVVLIEFDHQGPIALSGPRGEATRNHVHTVVRTPNGNDYGKDLLRQHYEAVGHDPDHGHVTP